ncbi:MAG: molybdenum cofactor biosynthesis protein MoaE [Pseudomonadota bacterium]
MTFNIFLAVMYKDPQISVQNQDFDVNETLNSISPDAGAVASFIGLVRADQLQQNGHLKKVEILELDCYQDLCQKMLFNIADQASRRWDLTNCKIIHRFGLLPVGARIVIVATASQHRNHALKACHYIIDWLKTDAPFWKQQHFSDGTKSWVDVNKQDFDAQKKWL